MPEAVIDFLEAVHVANHQGERVVVALASGQLAVKLQKERSRIGQASKVVGSRGAFGLLIFQSVLDGQRHLPAHCQQEPQMIGCERVTFSPVERENSNNSSYSLQRDGQS